MSQNASCGQGHTAPGSLPEAVGAARGRPSPTRKVQVRGNPAVTPSGAKLFPLTHVWEACLPACHDHSQSWGGDGAAPLKESGHEMLRESPMCGKKAHSRCSHRGNTEALGEEEGVGPGL